MSDWVTGPHSETGFLVLEKGKEFPGEIPNYDGGQYRFDRSGHWLYLYLDSPTEEEIHEIRTQPVLFGQALINNIVFLFATFGKLASLELPYSIWLIPEAYRPALDETELHPLVKIVLVDRKTKNVVELRACTFSPAFFNKLCQKIVQQVFAGWEGKDAYSKNVDHLYQTHKLGQIAAQSTDQCYGGD